MSFEKKYPNLYQFIGGWFPDADFEELTDKEVVKSFCDEQGAEAIAAIVEEAEDLLAHCPEFLSELEGLSNIFFEDSRAAGTWLKEITGHLKQQNAS